MNMTAKFFPSVSALADNFDAFILDLWGVIHDGQTLYPGVKECLQALRKANKKIILLSNAPRRAVVAQESLERMGITDDLYDAIVTSGEAAYQCLADTQSFLFKASGEHFFYIGLEKDRHVLAGLPYEEVPNPEAAQFVLLSHSYVDNQPLSELTPLLQACRANNLPLLCINPDLEIVRLGGQRVYCAGVLAQEYRVMGGEVIYFGKPHPAVYEACFKLLGDLPKSRIVAVGDNMMTDILGAQKAGIASVLITGGVLGITVGSPADTDYRAKCEQLFAREELTPQFVLPAFNW
jgi:HAD superfamily hydrolase (TIGR01459 family)